jgi:tripartite-type tricarboxylate transporter receptor subunit TctC
MKPTGLVVAAIALSASVPDGWSQGAPYPAKVIRVVNPVAPGGNQDIVARAYADQLARGFAQPVVVESRPGASAILGTRYVRSAPPDGYTLLAISNTFIRVPAMTADPGSSAANPPRNSPVSCASRWRSSLYLPGRQGLRSEGVKR